MTQRGIAVMLISLLAAVSACTSSSTTSVQTGSGTGYDSQYRSQTATTKGTYEQKQAEKQEGDSAITVMQLGMETGDVYPGEDYYAYAVIDNPDARKNLEYVWTSTSGEVTEVPEAERGRLQTLVEDKYNTAVPTTEAPVPLPQSGSLPAGATSEQPSEGAPTPTETPLSTGPAPTPTGGTAPLSTGTGTPVTPTADKDAQTDAQEKARLERLRLESESKRGTSGAVKTDVKRITRGNISETRIVAGPEDDAYFSDEDQAEISYETEGLSEEEQAALQELADEQRQTIENRADSTEIREDETGQDLRNSQRRLVSDDQRDEPEGSPNVVEGGIEGDPYKTGDRRDRGWGRKTTAEIDAERGLIAGSERLTDDLAEAETASSALRRRGGDDADEATEITAEDAYKRFSLVTDEPFVRWTPTRPGDAKLFVKVRWKTDDLTEATALPVEVRLREPRVEIANDEFPDIVREDEPLFIRLDADNLPAFGKGLFTLSFDPDVLSFREAELGEFFDDASGADLFYMQPDKLAGKVIFAIDSNTELANLSGGGPLLYVKFEAKRDVASRDETELALVQDTASQYVLDASGDNILPMAVDHPVYATSLVMPPRYGGQSGVERQLTPGGKVGETPADGAAAEAAAVQPGGTPATDAAAATAPLTPPDPNAAALQPGGGLVLPQGPDGQVPTPQEGVAPQ